MQPHVRTGVYSNYLADEGENRARAAYGANYERLVVVKNMNQNIRPA